MRPIKKVLDKTLARYVLVNVLCWVVGTGVMFLLYNLGVGGYWLASACNYLVGGTLGYFLNRKYTFHSQRRTVLELFKYIVHMLVCYFVSYGLAPNLCAKLYDHFALHAANNVSLLVGAAIFTILNYFGQRYVVFRPKKKDEAGSDHVPQ